MEPRCSCQSDGGAERGRLSAPLLCVLVSLRLACCSPPLRARPVCLFLLAQSSALCPLLLSSGSIVSVSQFERALLGGVCIEAEAAGRWAGGATHDTLHSRLTRATGNSAQRKQTRSSRVGAVASGRCDAACAEEGGSTPHDPVRSLSSAPLLSSPLLAPARLSSPLFRLLKFEFALPPRWCPVSTVS